MSAFALVSGQLFKAPEQRTSKAGKPFVTATIRVKDGEALQWWKVVAFSESVQAELMRLGDGDPVSIQGAFKAELYQPEGGVNKLSLSIIADRVLARHAAMPQLDLKVRDAMRAYDAAGSPGPLYAWLTRITASRAMP